MSVRWWVSAPCASVRSISIDSGEARRLGGSEAIAPGRRDPCSAAKTVMLGVDRLDYQRYRRPPHGAVGTAGREASRPATR